MITGLAAVSLVNFRAPRVSFLWHNLVAVVVVLAVGLVLSVFGSEPERSRGVPTRAEHDDSSARRHHRRADSAGSTPRGRSRTRPSTSPSSTARITTSFSRCSTRSRRRRSRRPTSARRFAGFSTSSATRTSSSPRSNRSTRRAESFTATTARISSTTISSSPPGPATRTSAIRSGSRSRRGSRAPPTRSSCGAGGCSRSSAPTGRPMKPSVAPNSRSSSSAAGRPASSWRACCPRSRSFALPRDFRHIDTATARVLLLEAGPRLLPAYARRPLGERARRDLIELGVEVRTSVRVTNVGDGVGGGGRGANRGANDFLGRGQCRLAARQVARRRRRTGWDESR